ncbi:hypothetical protein LZ683_09155 [Comamonas testosteroni]|uniref:hypothetical protein n=1 Tax=Comamonas testosteroni TaxID=285 RepID=UPI0023AABDB7|nr:hypothetical protein [Comamonas testosteroni]WEE79508.1 hypothetical protein LZ683_09155 [Comamonas testosteroni]
MRFLGKYGEHRVLGCLLAHDIEAYQAIKVNQDDYDITVVVSPTKVVRVQVKSTALGNKSTNNQIGQLNRNFDFLVVVIEFAGECRFFVLTKHEAQVLKGSSKHFGVSRSRRREFEVKPELLPYEDKWEKIRDA